MLLLSDKRKLYKKNDEDITLKTENETNDTIQNSYFEILKVYI